MNVDPASNNTLHQSMLTEPLFTTVMYYATCLVASVKAIAYLTQNCLLADADLRVGFSDRTLGTQLPSHHKKPGRDLRKQLQTVGILKDTGHETFRGMVTVPLLTWVRLSEADDSALPNAASRRDAATVTGVYGRRIDRHAVGETEATIGSGTFNGTALSLFEEIIVTDNILDAWTFYSAGYKHVVCAVGGELQIADLKSVKRVLLASSTVDCEAFSHCEIFQLRLPVGQSVHQYQLAQRDAGTQDPLGVILRAATWNNGCCTQPSAPEPPQTPLASPVPIKLDDLQVTITADDITITTEWRRYRIRGLERNALPGVMKVNLLIYNERTERFHVDNFDLYHARSRRTFTMEAADEIGASESQLRSDLGRVLLKLEQLQAEQKQLSKAVSKARAISETERAEAMGLLQSNNLLDRILDDFDACGIVGERTGKLVGYLAATSRLLAKPLGVIIQSSSAAGKSSLAEAVLRFMPKEEQLACSAMTSQSLYYLGNENLKHKILSISEEEGVRDASYQLKLLQSEGHLSLVATGKESGTGRTNTERYEVQGPVALMMTTTSPNIDPELLNRCLVIAIDESCSQTAAIQTQQRFNETLQGYLQKRASEPIVERHRNAQRLLRRLPVFNPYATQLSFIGQQTRHRRDHGKYLTLIKAITLLHQYQREVKQMIVEGQTVDYLEVTRQDIVLANQIAEGALGRSIDELAEPTRRLLVELYDWLQPQAESARLAVDEMRFTRRAAREALGWGSTQLAYHLERLCREEYIVRAAGTAGKLCQYRLLYDGRGRAGQTQMLKLTDATTLTESELTPQGPEPTTHNLSA